MPILGQGRSQKTPGDEWDKVGPWERRVFAYVDSDECRSDGGEVEGAAAGAEQAVADTQKLRSQEFLILASKAYMPYIRQRDTKVNY